MTTISRAALAAISGTLATLIAAALPAFAGPFPTAMAVASHPALKLAEASGGSEYSLGSLRISAPWMRATAKGAAVAGGYLTVTNIGSASDRLMSVASDIAGTAEVHEMSLSNGVMTMRPAPAPLEIQPGASLELKPGGYHVMFTQLRHAIQEGDKVKATLTFDRAGKIEIEFVAGGLAAKGPAGAATPGAPMQMMPGHKM